MYKRLRFEIWLWIVVATMLGACAQKLLECFHPLLALAWMMVASVLVAHVWWSLQTKAPFGTQAAEAIAAEAAGEHLSPNMVRTALLVLVEDTSEAPTFTDVLAWSRSQLEQAWHYAKHRNPVVAEILGKVPRKPAFLERWPKL